jgi:hypothetical protein
MIPGQITRNSENAGAIAFPPVLPELANRRAVENGLSHRASVCSRFLPVFLKIPLSGNHAAEEGHSRRTVAWLCRQPSAIAKGVLRFYGTGMIPRAIGYPAPVHTREVRGAGAGFLGHERQFRVRDSTSEDRFPRRLAIRAQGSRRGRHAAPLGAPKPIESDPTRHRTPL